MLLFSGDSGNRAAIFVSLGLVFAGALSAQMTIAGYNGLTVSASSNGIWSMSIPNPAWQFRGATGATVYNLRIDSGADNLGIYQEIAFDYSISSSGRSASIRAYSGRPAVVFSVTWNNTSSNTSPFPLFTSWPGNL